MCPPAPGWAHPPRWWWPCSRLTSNGSTCLSATTSWRTRPLLSSAQEAGLQGGKQDQYAAAFGGFNFMEFGRNGSVLVNPLRVKEWVISELEASLLLYFTGNSRTSAEIIQEQSRNVRDRNGPALDAMHAIKEESFRMKECLLRGDFPATARSAARQLGIEEAHGQPDHQRAHRAALRLRSRGRRVLRQDLRGGRRRLHDVPHRPDSQGQSRGGAARASRWRRGLRVPFHRGRVQAWRVP